MYELNRAVIGTIWLKHSSFNRAWVMLEKCDKICVSHSYREPDGKMCDLF